MGSSRPSSKTERARRAVAAMKPLGFSTKQCTAVLKRLLKVYGQNWALIEDENYRALADAILDAQVSISLPSSPSILHSQIHSPDKKAFCLWRGGALFRPMATGNRSRSRRRSALSRQKETRRPPSSVATATREDSLGPPSPPSPSPTAEQHATTTELAISPRADSPPQARASTRALGKRRHRQTIDAYLQLEDTVVLREPKPEPVDMDVSRCQDVQPGLVGSSRRGVASSSGFRELPPPQSD